MELFVVFLQGMISFFSPCIFPLLPVYMSYLSGQKKNILRQTFFFVLGISCTFLVLGLGVSALGQFFSAHQSTIAKVSGVIMILFGLYQFGVLGKSNVLEREHRLSIQTDKVNAFSAFLLGFTFSFAWTPCVGPALTSVLLMTSSADTMMSGLALMGVYIAGFILPFMVLGFFTSRFLDWTRAHRNIVKYTVKIGAILLMVMGVMTFVNAAPSSAPQAQQENPMAPDFELKDQNGEVHRLSDYKGKVVFLNFWASWCGPCRNEIPHIQKVYEDLKDDEDVVILSLNNEDPAGVKEFMDSFGMTYPTLFDETGNVFRTYGVRSFPTTYMIDKDGYVYGYIRGSLNEETIYQMIEETKVASQK